MKVSRLVAPDSFTLLLEYVCEQSLMSYFTIRYQIQNYEYYIYCYNYQYALLFLSHFLLGFLLTLATKRMTVFAAQSCAVDETNTIAHYDCQSLSKIAFNNGMPGCGVFLVRFDSFEFLTEKNLAL